jgi:hypothetical protein
VTGRAICVSRDERVRTAVTDGLRQVGLDVECHDELPALSARDVGGDDRSDRLVVCVIDREGRRAAGGALRAYGVPVVVVGDDLADDGLVALMLDAPVSHVVTDPADRHVGIASEKLASGNYFGLEQYLARGAGELQVGERVVGSQDERRFAVGEVCAWAEAVGARRAALHRITSVVDELLMNALREAPCRAIVRWACDSETLAISVGDPSGALAQRDVIDNVRRARGDRGRPRDSQPVIVPGSAADKRAQSEGSRSSGAGLGLYLVLANVASLIVNIERGRRTEVVCLFDRAGRAKPAASAPRSFHVFAHS